MVVDQLVRFTDITDETLTWTRPNFFAFQYELACSTGILARLSVNGIGPGRHVLAETAEEAWRFDVFPLDRRDVPVSQPGTPGMLAIYHRSDPFQIDFQNGPSFRLRNGDVFTKVLEDREAQPVFTVEQAEAFPHWRADLKLAPEAVALPQLPILLAAVCCSLVFD